MKLKHNQILLSEPDDELMEIAEIGKYVVSFRDYEKNIDNVWIEKSVYRIPIQYLDMIQSYRLSKC